jgi:glycine/D-amino acid oxidase-like deaminating enzyme
MGIATAPVTPADAVSSTWRKPIPPPATLPSTVDVVIIGGGIAGIATAWFLARQGVATAVCEKGHIAGEQSGRNWGWVRKQGRDLRELPMMIESMRIWADLRSELGEDVGFARGGCLFAARTEKQLAGFEQWLTLVRDFDLDSRLLSASEVACQVRGASLRWAGGLLTASDGRAEPQLATAALARGAARHGVHVLTGCAARGLDLEAGRVAGVVTEHGRIRAPQVVCAAGAWTATFCRSVGLDLPQLRVRGTVARTAAAGTDILDGNLYDDAIGIRRRNDGGYTVAHAAILDHPVTPDSFRWFGKFLPALRQQLDIVKLSLADNFLAELFAATSWPLDQPSPFERTRVLNPPPNRSTLRRLRRDLDTLFPALADVPFVESWAGMIESTPDIVPVIDQFASIPGFYVASGFSGHGFGIGPGAGKAIAGMVTGTETGIDLTPFRYRRFFDGSPMQLQASI